ncbi:recombinase family protein [Bacillus sp. FSL K6-1005]|uniref:recombinase family protein n=1 Tax=Bacillus sp. FSL K6-1005 TaxID=2954676 RepID=UPI0030F83E45
MGSIPPYDYNLHEGNLLIRDNYTVEVVRCIFKKYLEGWGHEKIARYLTNKDIPTPSQVINKAILARFYSKENFRTPTMLEP